MQFLNQHYLVSSSYLHAQTAETHACPQTSARMLRQLFDGQMVCKPVRQRETAGADANHHVYALTQRGIRFLKQEALWIDTLTPTGPWVHQFMTACITASIHIQCNRKGLGFIPGHEITGNLAVKVPFWWNGARFKYQLIPDSLFAIRYPAGYVAYAVEADRNTEPNDPVTPHRKSARRMIKQYAEFISNGRYKQAYGLNCPLVLLYVSVSPGHNRHVLNIVQEEIGACNYIAFACAPEFRTPFCVPKDLLFNENPTFQRSGFCSLDLLRYAQ